MSALLNKPAARCGPAHAARGARVAAVRPVAALKVSLIGPLAAHGGAGGRIEKQDENI